MTRSCSRARTTERGFALIAALVLAVLYFGLMELLLMDSSRELGEARRFKARIVAQTLAENGAERAALNLRNAASAEAPRLTDSQGTSWGRMTNVGGEFKIWGEAETAGVIRQKAAVYLQGRVDAATGDVKIDFSNHTQ